MHTEQTPMNERQGLSWPDWQARNRRQDRRGAALRAKLTSGAAAAALVLALSFWGRAADYHAWLGVVVCASAIRVAFLAGSARRHDWAVLFVGIAVLYNPVFPMFTLAGTPAFLLVAASVAAFAASLFMPVSRAASPFAGR